jgi:hypothetical protein
MTILDRIMQKVTKQADGCWVWTGGHNGRGYGSIIVNKKRQYVHRLMLELAEGPIEKGLEVDHLCDVPSCCNPLHLQAVTPLENKLRSKAITMLNRVKTHCPKGHEYSGDNLRVGLSKDGQTHRLCRTCDREWHRRAYVPARNEQGTGE